MDFLLEINRLDTMSDVGSDGNLVLMDLSKHGTSSNIADVLAALSIQKDSKKGAWD